MDDKVFPTGIFIKPPHEKAPDFVKAKVRVRLPDAIPWLSQLAEAGEEWVSMDVKVSQNGKMYMEVDTWKPDGAKSATGGTSKPDFDDDLPW